MKNGLEHYIDASDLAAVTLNKSSELPKESLFEPKFVPERKLRMMNHRLSTG